MADNIEAVGLEFDTKAYEAAIRRAERRLDDLEDSVDRSTRSAKRQENQFARNARAAVALVAAYGGFRILEQAGRFVFNTNREFEVLEARLVSITGSTQKAASAFSMITDFARTTPFEVQNLTQAFTTLQAAGIQPTTEMLRGIGNFAAAMGRDITDAVEAILRASQGGTERLRESFFIPIQKEGEELVISFRGQTKRVSADAATLIDHFTELGETEFGGGMERQMSTIDGALSNLKDTASILAKDVGDAGLAAAITESVQAMDAAIGSADGLAVVLGGALGGALREVTELGIEWALILNEIGGESANVAGTKISLQNLIDEGQVEVLRSRLREFEDIVLALEEAGESGLFREGNALVAQVGFSETEARQLIDFIRRGIAEIEGGSPGADGAPGPSAPEADPEERERAMARRRALALRLHQEALADFNREQEDAIRAAERHEQAIDKVEEALDEERLRLSEGEEAAFRFSLAVQGITGAEQEALVTKWKVVEALQAQEKAAERAAKEAFAELEAEYQQLERSADRMAGAITDAFLDVGDGAFDLLDAIGEAVDGMIQEFTRLATQRFIAEPLQGAFLGALDGGIPDAPTPIPEPSNPLPSGLSPRAPGGIVVVNTTQNLSVNAIDTRTGAEFIRQQKGEILAQFAEGLQESTVLQSMAGRR